MSALTTGLALGSVLLLLGLPLQLHVRRAGTALVFVGAVLVLSVTVGGLGEAVFGFPSGAVQLSIGLALPLSWLFPRCGWLLLSAALVVAATQLAASGNVLRDVFVSTVVVVVMALAVARMLRTPPARAMPRPAPLRRASRRAARWPTPPRLVARHRRAPTFVPQE